MLAASAIVVTVHVAFFRHQYFNGSVFPWDFLGGYHAQAVAWFRDGSMLSPPRWFPYGSMGFPAWWALQSGGWYLPLQALSWLGVEYTLVTATKFQSLHVLVGAFGVLALARAMGLGWRAATVAAVTYHFGSIFYSNQQHVDIIRGAAWLPWLMIFAHPGIYRRSPVFILVGGILVFQFLISSYPGVIVSAFYSTLILFLYNTFEIDRRQRRAFVVMVAMVVVCGVLLSMLKWTTPLLIGRSSLDVAGGTGFVNPTHLLTLFFSYNVPALAGDVTMQSLWTPPVALLLLPFLRRSGLPRGAAIFVVLAVVALSVGIVTWFAPEARSIVPGLGVSRFPHSDWRPVLHLSMAMLGAMAYAEVARAPALAVPSALARVLVGVSCVLGLGVVAYAAGYAIRDLRSEIATAVVFLGAVGGAVTVRRDAVRPFLVWACVLAFAAGAAYIQYVRHVPQTWQMPWNARTERAMFGARVGKLIEEPRVNWRRRPMRESYGLDTSSYFGKVQPLFNRAWYAQEFATYGYSNLRAREWLSFERALDADGRLAAFMARPSQTILVDASTDAATAFGEACDARRESCSAIAGAEADILRYGLDSARFRIVAPIDLTMVENEMWYRGWVGTLCDGHRTCHEIASQPVGPGLRSWAIPAGEWTLRTRFEQPWKGLSVALGGAGLLLLVVTFLVALAHRVGALDPTRFRLGGRRPRTGAGVPSSHS